MSKKKSEIYPLKRAGFFHLGSFPALARQLGFKLKVIKNAARNRDTLYFFKEEVLDGKHRRIQCPIGIMRRLHERLTHLLNRIDRPEYLHSPRKGKSYISNAQEHSESATIASLDIKQFYPSTTDEQIFRFFHHRLGMDRCAAGLLTQICTIQGHLPFGSPLSPILCFQAHRQLFDEIQEVCKENGLTMTLYVDDIGISGKNVPNRVLYEVKKLIKNAGRDYHKVRRRARSRNPVVTGVRLGQEGTSPANKSHLRMKARLDELSRTREPIDQLQVINRLIGMNQHMLRVYASASPARSRLERQKAWLHNERGRLNRLLRKASFLTKPSRPIPEPANDSSPF